jgi:hypothetical protein
VVKSRCSDNDGLEMWKWAVRLRIDCSISDSFFLSLFFFRIEDLRWCIFCDELFLLRKRCDGNAIVWFTMSKVRRLDLYILMPAHGRYFPGEHHRIDMIMFIFPFLLTYCDVFLFLLVQRINSTRLRLRERASHVDRYILVFNPACVSCSH